ncbi:hypothetical protein KY998_10810 [Bacillus paralicheniformis]|uniref:hypothetical protein n=1 Tax=Bacillus paralicheniformis TaxID=1648923 RepID=UPI000F701033|nr:hypothetical protein [Bacillus paralicheniformis]MBG9882818.1 hypothetical protein [Bacillus paralicheniformis]MCY7461944.1 hypothetical protein [Bacillus paralicheniformis]MDE1394027.1 hypothetical protein [Bacillus paralicheniformis]MEC1934963.1 hypothetical protein [Bacillus paralicheniformis]MEC2097276.1 hypothetical protein [Bacillus paralicheniformis]
MNLNQMVNESLKNIEEEGFVQATVEKKMKQTMESIIDDIFSSWSNFGKNLKEHIQQELKVNLDELKLEAYNHMILNVVKEKMDEAIHVQGTEKIKKQLDYLLSDTKTEYKLSEIIERMKDKAMEWDSDEYYDRQISLHVEKASVLSFVYFDKEEYKEKYECQYKLSIDNEGRLNSCRIDDKEFDNKVIMGGLHGVDELLFKIYTTGAKVLLDENDISVYFPSEDEDY